jgi:hypothetical protein
MGHLRPLLSLHGQWDEMRLEEQQFNVCRMNSFVLKKESGKDIL